MIYPSQLKNFHVNCLRLNSLYSLSYEFSDFICVQKYMDNFKESILTCFVFFYLILSNFVLQGLSNFGTGCPHPKSLEVFKRGLDVALGDVI